MGGPGHQGLLAGSYSPVDAHQVPVPCRVAGALSAAVEGPQVPVGQLAWAARAVQLGLLRPA